MQFKKSDKKEAIQRRRERVMRDEEERIQTKLEVSQPGDAQEQEADTIARKVMDGGDANIRQLNAAPSDVQTKSEGGALYADSTFQRSLDSSKGAGQGMDDATKSEMESRMGADFSDVKIHTGSNAHEMSESISAKAFTHGSDIYFKNGNYNPGTGEGKELLAHELVHTQQQGNGVGRKVMRQVEDIVTINRQVQALNLDDFSGLAIQVLGGYISVYDSTESTEPVSKVESGNILKTGKKSGNRYEVLETSPVKGNKQSTENTPTDPTKTNTPAESKKQYVEFGGTDWADMTVVELLPERLLYRALADPGNDLSHYRIRVKWKFMNLFDDDAAKKFAKENAAKNQELQLLAKNEQGNYPVDVADAGGKIARKYIRGSVPKNSFEIIGVSKDRYAYNLNQNRGEIEDLSGYTIRLFASEASFLAYPSRQVTYGSSPLVFGTEVSVLKKVEISAGDGYYQIARDKQTGYMSAGIAVSDFEIVSAPTALGKVKDAATVSNEADVQNERNIKLATVDYTKVQNILQMASDNIGKEIKDFNKTFDQLTAAEISVLRGEHRMMLLKTLIDNKGQTDRIIRLLENTGMEVSGEMHDYLMADKATHDKLFNELSYSDEDKKRMAAAVGAAVGKDDFRLEELKTLLANKDDYSSIDEFAYTLSDPDMQSLDAQTRGDLIDAMLIEADYYTSISSDSDDETMVRLVRTANREDKEDAELLKFQKRIHPNFENESGNLYGRLIDTMATDYARDFKLALSELYPGTVNTVLIRDLHEKLALEAIDRNDWSDEILEWTYTMSAADFDQLSVTEKIAIIDTAFSEFEIGAEEETALVNIFRYLRPEVYPDMRDALEKYSFYRLHELISRIDEDPGATDIRTFLNPVMEESTALVDKCVELLNAKDSLAERYMFLLTDSMLEGLDLDVRKMMIDESADYWADGTDEMVIIRLVKTTQEDKRADLYSWFQGADDNGYANHQNWVMHSVDGANRDLFMQAVGALKDNTQAVTDAKSGFDYGVSVGSDSKVLESVGLLTNDQMATLDFETRIEYIRYICNDTGRVWTHGENIVTRLIETTPAKKNPTGEGVKEEDKSHVTRLFDRFSANGGELYTQVHDALDDETFNAMQQALQALVMKQRYADGDGNAEAAKIEDEKMRQMGFMHPNAILWQKFSAESSSVKYNDKGEIVVNFALTGSKKHAQEFQRNHPGYTFRTEMRETTGDGKTQSSKQKYEAHVFTAVFQPTQMVAVIQISGFSSADVFLSAAQSNTKVDVMPAIGLFELEVEFEREVREAMLLMLDIILLAVGIGELTLALRGIRLAFAIADVVIGALGLGVKAFRKQLMQTEAGRVFLGIVDGITMAYAIVGIGRLAAAMFSFGKVLRLRNQLNVLKGVVKDAEMLRSLELLVSKIEQPGAMYKALFKISSESEYKSAIELIDTYPGLMKAERDALKKMADLKLAHPSMGPKAFLNYLSETPEELVKASAIQSEAELSAFKKELDTLEKEGKLSAEARQDAELAATTKLEEKTHLQEIREDLVYKTTVNKKPVFKLDRRNLYGKNKIIGEPESVVKDDALREAYAAEKAAKRSTVDEVYLGVEADKYINMGKAGKKVSVDVVAINKQGKFLLFEAKGKNIEHGLEQLEESAQMLGKEQVIRFELVIPENLQVGYKVVNGELYVINSADKFEKVLIFGKPVRVTFTTIK